MTMLVICFYCLTILVDAPAFSHYFTITDFRLSKVSTRIFKFKYGTWSKAFSLYIPSQHYAIQLESKLDAQSTQYHHQQSRCHHHKLN